MNSDRDFLVRFESGDLTAAGWNHVARLRVAFLLLRASHFQDGLRRLRTGLRRLERRIAIREGRLNQFHETQTLAWARIVAARLRPRDLSQSWASFVQANAALLDSSLLFEHYLPARIASSRARREFVLPDREPLPVRGATPAVRPAA